MATWSFAESMIWPIIPDFLLVLLVIVQPRRARYALAACIAGSAAGASLLYCLAWTFPEAATRVLPYVPLAFEADVVSVRERVSQNGAFAFLWQPISGIPFKVWGIVGATNGVPPILALPIAILARAARMVVIAVIATLVGARFKRRIRDSWLVGLSLYVLIFALAWILTFPSGG
jgi:membrane protein YqaA with SNARE-associated domain